MSSEPIVLRVSDATALFGSGHVRWMVSSGWWQRPLRGVVVRHSGPLTGHQRIVAELLGQSPSAVLAGLTAAAMDGFKGFPSPSISMLVPRGVRRRPRDGVVVRSAVQLGPSDVHPSRTPPRTRMPRSIVDAAAWAGTDLRSQAVIAASVQQGLVTPIALAAVVDRLSKAPRRTLIQETIRDVSGGSLSEYEVLFVRLCRRNGFPMPTRQRRRPDASGRMRYHDADFDEYQLTVEVDGQQHMDVVPWWEDMMRDNDLVADEGRWVMRFAGFALRQQPDRVADVLRRFFARHSGRR